ncbi:MAG: hypothetical protein JW957_01565, partial [Candidatus Omnitrophica bacterium]|nr:hypothetical protein [Candidatus Omnitrophota bacterium]
MCDVNVSILWFFGSKQIKAKSAERLDREGIGSRKGLRLILTVWDLKSVGGFPREGSTPSLGTTLPTASSLFQLYGNLIFC